MVQDYIDLFLLFCSNFDGLFLRQFILFALIFSVGNMLFKLK